MFLRIHTAITSIFSPRSPSTVFCICLSLLAFLGWIDHTTGEYSLIVFYVIPVSLMAWFVTRTSGILFCILSLVARFFSDIPTIASLPRRPDIHYWNIFIEFLFLLIMSLLFSALRKTLDEEKNRAGTDALTCTLNRRSFFELAEHELKRARRYSLPLTMAYIDLDNFKFINDRMGHATGDNLLVTVVKNISGSIRSTDILARLGGDEFVLLLPETSFEPAGLLLEKIRNQLLESMTAKGWPVTFSIGAVSYSLPLADIDTIVGQADLLMYEVKRSGKNRLHHLDLSETINGQG